MLEFESHRFDSVLTVLQVFCKTAQRPPNMVHVEKSLVFDAIQCGNIVCVEWFWVVAVRQTNRVLCHFTTSMGELIVIAAIVDIIAQIASGRCHSVCGYAKHSMKVFDTVRLVCHRA